MPVEVNMDDQQQREKTLIAVLASHDSVQRNNSLARLLERLCKTKRGKKKLDGFYFLFTGGTYDRVLAGTDEKARADGVIPVNSDTKEFVLGRATRLPSRVDGGVTVLAYMIVRGQCSIIWPFFTPLTPHWLNPENLALMRLCDQWHVKRLMNTGSVEEWFDKEANSDAYRDLQECPPKVAVGLKGAMKFPREGEPSYDIKRPSFEWPPELAKRTIALIAHDEMKARMVEFAVDYEPQLEKFDRILATGTTGRQVEDATRTLKDTIDRRHSGPKGGDIEIATEILFGQCHIVVFFVDPLRPHPHIEDIRVVFGACMIQDQVRMLTNEMQAREWMDRVVKRQGAVGPQ
jgi:methylglyoxal synthase